MGTKGDRHHTNANIIFLNGIKFCWFSNKQKSNMFKNNLLTEIVLDSKIVLQQTFR
jgi:hypothetical protein